MAHPHLVAKRPAVSVGIQWWVLASRIRSDDGKAGWCVAVSGGKDGVCSNERLQLFAECSIDFDKLIVGVGERRYNVAICDGGEHQVFQCSGDLGGLVGEIGAVES